MDAYLSDEDESDDESVNRQRGRRTLTILFSYLAVKRKSGIMPRRGEAQGHKGVCLEDEILKHVCWLRGSASEATTR